MSGTSSTGASGNDPQCAHDASPVPAREGCWEGPKGSQAEVTQSPGTEGLPPQDALLELPENEGDPHDKEKSLAKGESDVTDTESGGEAKSARTENAESCVHLDIACEVASALVELGGVGSEIKTAFKDVQTELLSAVSEVKTELSNVLTNSQFCLGASDQNDTRTAGDRGSEDSAPLIRNESESSKDECNVKDVVVRNCSSSESSLEKENSPVADSKNSDDSEVVVAPSADVPDRSDCSGEGATKPLDIGEGEANEMAMNLNPEGSVDDKGGLNACFTLHEELSKKVVVEVTEDVFKDKVDDKQAGRKMRETHFPSNVFTIQSRLSEECECEGEDSGRQLLCHYGGEHGLKAQPLSAPSTPVPSTATTSRKALRSQVCRGRRVSFPEDETHLISSYLEPVNPWQQMAETTVEEIAAAYRSSCERHRTQPLPGVLHQIKALPLVLGGRVECLNLRAQRLDSSQCEGLEEIFRRVQFKILDLEGCCLDDDTAIPLFDMIEFYDSATQLNISCNDKIGFRGWQACSRMLKKTPSVEYLDARSTNLNETNMPILGRALRLGARLHTLHLESCNLTGRPLIMLTAALRQNETLTELFLAENRLGVNDCIQLSNLVRANSTLLLLDLRNNNVQDAGCGHVCEGITEQQNHQQQLQGQEGGEKAPRCKGLRSLVLWNNHLTQQSAPHLANMLATTRALETLNLGRNNLTSEGILRLKESLLRNHALLRLGLQAARIADEGAVALAEYTADNTIIQHIDLRDNPIHVAGLLALAHSLRLNSTVIQMDIDSDCRTEPSAELADQHAALQKEIKEICQRNLTQSHLRVAGQIKSETPEGGTSKPPRAVGSVGGVIRKISLTCETTHVTSRESHATETTSREEEKQRYVSPAPSPIPSPCPSPSPSPSPSPVPSPLRHNRFRVFRVTESSKSSPDLMAGAGSTQTTMLCNAVPVAHSGRSLSAGDLSQPPKQSGMRPNRFGIGGRFTVTRVAEPCSLPSAQEKVSAITTYTNTSATAGPKIVISSPVRVERGFSIDETTSSENSEKSGEKPARCEPSTSAGVTAAKLPEDRAQLVRDRLKSDSDVVVGCGSVRKGLSEGQRQEMTAQKSSVVCKNNAAESQKNEKDSDSVSSSDLTDSGFLDEGSCGRSSGSVSPSLSSPHPEGDRDSLLSSSVDSTNQEDTGLGLPMQGSLPVIPVLPCNIQQFDIQSLHDPPKRAPLAAMENGSFDSDSEDSELMTQSSDSTHSDEVRITTEHYEPRQAWGAKQEQAQVPVGTEALTAPESARLG